MSKASLKSRVLRAGLWLLAGHGLAQLIRLMSNLIMTRLLVPQMFGMIAVAWIIMTGLQMLSDFGLRQSIVQSSRGEDAQFLGTAWVAQIFRGGILCLLGIGLATGLHFAQALNFMAVGTVYADPQLPLVVAVLAASALISGFESMRIALADRNLALGSVTRMDILSQLAGILCMLVWAMIDRSIWALVVSGLVSSLTRTVLSHVLLPGNRDRWIWSKQALQEIIKFGKWIFLTSILGFAVNSGDRLLLGGLVSSELLGLYSIAFLIVDAVAQIISKLLGTVSFPAFSEVARDRPEALRATYYRFRIPVDLLALFSAGALFSSGTAVIDLLFDDRYRSAGHIVEILSLSLIFIRYGVTEMCCLALGKPRILTELIAIRGAALFVLVPLCFHLFGFDGALWVIALHRAFSLLPIIHFKIKHHLLDLRKELIVLPIFLVGIASGKAFSACSAFFHQVI
jgi:O-antigen/teichoic acid export membrane protein